MNSITPTIFRHQSGLFACLKLMIKTRVLIRSVASLSFLHLLPTSGNGEVSRQPLPHPLPRLQLPVQRRLHHEPRLPGARTIGRRGSPDNRLHPGGVHLQIQLRQEAVQRHPLQNHGHERGRLHHPRPPLARWRRSGRRRKQESEHY